MVSAPVTVCGDIHGQIYDLFELFKRGGELPDNSYVFMGDFIDRGSHSVETIVLLLTLKLKYPSRVTLLRGNHESRQTTQFYGFYDEVQRKYGNANVWKYIVDVFDYLALGALIEGKILCVHGGLSPDIKTIDQIRTIDRVKEIPHSGPFSDLMWSDPDHIKTWSMSSRGAGWLFGYDVTKDFNQINGLDLICRAHQLVNEGHIYWFDKRLVTVWSAPNYCYRMGNSASILKLDEKLERKFITFESVPESVQILPKAMLPYFL